MGYAYNKVMKSYFFPLICLPGFYAPRLPLARVGHIAFRHDVTSVRAYKHIGTICAYLCMCICHDRNQVQVYQQV